MMRFAIIALLCCSWLGVACTGAKLASDGPGPERPQPRDPYLHFETPHHDFGTIKLGDTPTYTYVFTNTSGEALELELVSGCECTEIQWPQNKVFQPEEQGSIQIRYDSKLEEGIGEHNKTIDVLLKKEDPETGYQIIKEVKFRVVIEL